MPPAAPDQLRRANTALVLRTLRDHGPGSRSALARRTGLAKATVGAIVGELAEHAVVVEGEASSQGRGRPSTPVGLVAGSVLGLGLEVNVDYVAAALVDLAGSRVLTTTREVPHGEDALDVLEGLALEVRREAPGRIVGAHLAVPGLVERDHATVRLAPNLGWTDTRPGDRLAASLGLPVQVDNDANLAAVAEMRERHPDVEVVIIESGGDNLSATFSPELADLTIYVIDVAAGEEIPRKGGPAITKSDILVINKTDLAPYVGASLDVMRRDSLRMRGERPFHFASLRNKDGIDEIIARIREIGGL